MDGEAVKEVERIVREAAGNTVEIDGKAFSTTPLYDPRKSEPIPTGLGLNTLQGLVDYCREPTARVYTAGRGRFLHVIDVETVRLQTGIFGQFEQHAVLACAKAIVPDIQFGEWQDPETFNIALLSHFADTRDRAVVLALTGNIRSDASVTVAEDGVSQSVTAMKGVAFKANQPIPTVVHLRPWRTFSEIAEQPESAFILRIRPGDASRGTLPACALFEADGGVWRLAAIKSVKDWLRDALGDEIAVYG